MPEPGGPSAGGRVLALIAAAAIAVALIGFVTGTDPEEYEVTAPPRPAAARPVGDVPPARTHAELERQPWGSGAEASGWAEAREAAARAELEGEAPTSGGADLATTRVERATQRAFAGAPPTIPHPVQAGGAPECLACHADGFALAGRRAGVIPHDELASCTQCHTASASFAALPASAAAEAQNRFVGLASPGAGATAYEGAPPSVPHPTWMRERCDSCHGPSGRAALQTPHPERRSCLQCHPATGGPGASR